MDFQLILKDDTSERAAIILNCRVTQQRRTKNTTNAPIQIARFTGSFRRISSAAWASASRLMRIGISQTALMAAPRATANWGAIDSNSEARSGDNDKSNAF